MTQFYIAAAIVAFIVAPLIIFIFKFLFKKTIFYLITILIVMNSLVAAVCGLFIGFSGNLWYLVPCSALYTVGLFFSIQYLKRSIGKPLSTMTKNIELLAHGSLSVQFDNKIAQKEHELGYISTALINMLGNLKESVQIAKLVSNGKLFSAANSSAKNKNSGDLDIALKKMIQKLNITVSNISNRSSSIALGSEELNNSAQVVAQGASEQAASIEEISSSMEQMAGNINQNAEHAQRAEQIAKKSSDMMGQVKSSTETTFSAIREISDKIEVIDEIADKTNLLAINAAVEAARAGVHGKGFAVVATEVRKLAERSRDSAEKIMELVKHCVREAEQSGTMLNDLTPEAERAFTLVREISMSCAEQRVGVEQMSAAITQLNQVTQQNAASADELSSTAENFNSQSTHLQEDVAFFKLSRDNEKAFNIEKVKEQMEYLQTLLDTKDATEEYLKTKTAAPETPKQSHEKAGPKIELETDNEYTEAFDEELGIDETGNKASHLPPIN